MQYNNIETEIVETGRLPVYAEQKRIKPKLNFGEPGEI
jgi:hypothetical protein